MNQIFITIIFLISLNCVIEITKSYQIVQVFNLNDPINDNNLKKKSHNKNVIIENYFYMQPKEHESISESNKNLYKKKYEKNFGTHVNGKFVEINF